MNLKRCLSRKIIPQNKVKSERVFLKLIIAFLTEMRYTRCYECRDFGLSSFYLYLIYLIKAIPQILRPNAMKDCYNYALIRDTN